MLVGCFRDYTLFLQENVLLETYICEGSVILEADRRENNWNMDYDSHAYCLRCEE